jgi:hypothetical protein
MCVPKNKYPLFQTSISPLLHAYSDKLQESTGHPASELKSSLIARLPLDFRLFLTKGFVRALKFAGALVAAIYSSARGIMMERVRTNLMGEEGQRRIL